MVLSAHLHTIGALEQQNSSIRDIHRCQSTSHKIITTRAIDNIELLAVPLHVEDSREHTIAILLLYRKIITYRIVLSDASATLYDTRLIEHTLCQGRLSTTIIAEQGNVLDFLCLIDFHVGYMVV